MYVHTHTHTLEFEATINHMLLKGMRRRKNKSIIYKVFQRAKTTQIAPTKENKTNTRTKLPHI
jgi:hypothetical protein